MKPDCTCSAEMKERCDKEREQFTHLPPLDWTAYGQHHCLNCRLATRHYFESRALNAEAKLEELGVTV